VQVPDQKRRYLGTSYAECEILGQTIGDACDGIGDAAQRTIGVTYRHDPNRDNLPAIARLSLEDRAKLVAMIIAGPGVGP
jgi:hypothetical protein